jgi:hypothetical protein
MNRTGSLTQRTPAVVAVLVMAIFLAWRCLTLGMADFFVLSNPVAAIDWRPAHSSAQYEVAQADFLAHRDADAIVHARLAIASYPLDGRAYRIVAAVAEAAGNGARARELFELTERRAPRDLPTRIKLAEYAFKTSDRSRAMHEVDMLLRIQPEIYPVIVPRLVRLSEDASAIDPIADALSHHPAWRKAFLSALSVDARDPAMAAGIYSRLARVDGLSADEIEQQRSLQIRIHDRAGGNAVVIGSDHTAAARDWFALMDWGSISDSAYTQAEDAFDTIGTQ